MQEASARAWLVPVALVYLTFFLDNVLLTVLVPIVPEWIRGEGEGANGTVHGGGAQAAVGLVLSAKAGAQLACAGRAAAAVCGAGAGRVLRVGTALLLAGALAFGAVAGGGWRGAAAGVAAGAGRAVHGAGAALAGVAGLALAARAAPAPHARRALAALLGAVALGVLVGYPFGAATYALWSRPSPFLIVALALAADLLMQYKFLDKEEYNRTYACAAGGRGGCWWAGGDAVGRAAAGAVLLTTSVMAALEPTLPLWIADTFHTQRWVGGVVFVPDSAAYLAATTAVGALAAPTTGAVGRARLAVLGVAAVALAALAIPHAPSVAWLAWPHAALGAGLGATDAALVPALLTPAGAAPRAAAARTPHRAALVQAAASAAYVVGPVCGGLCAWLAGFPTTMRALGVLNLLYAVLLYRSTYTLQWEDDDDEDDDDDSTSGAAPPATAGTHEGEGEGETLQLKRSEYATFH